MVSIKRVLVQFIIFLFVFFNLKGQKYIKDSIFVNFPLEVTMPLSPFTLQLVTDSRNEPGHVLQISEKKQYVFIPVDYLYCFKDPLKDEIINSIHTDSTRASLPQVELNIIEFWPGVRKGGFISEYYLKTCFEYSIQTVADTNKIKRKLVYETTIPYKTAKKKTNIAYEKVIAEWHRQFVNDLNNLSLSNQNTWEILVPGIRPDDFLYKTRLNAMSAFHYGIDWYGFEGEIFFSSPEADNFFIRNFGTVRYIHHENYESLLFGKNNENFNLRVNKSLLLQLQSKILIGLNRWNDFDTQDHELWEIMQLCLSSSQLVQYDVKDKNGLILNLGLIEDAYYIYNKYNFRIGIKGGIGFKF